jgi:hypothetical protein
MQGLHIAVQAFSVAIANGLHWLRRADQMIMKACDAVVHAWNKVM